ncbi:MAG TPA: phosphoribosylformylglycinamidine synthase I [Tepidisphaeraceae bacterium]|nr:phosphoribosylformylglycinamidine synthase I [Tepidisphaeraceae bacterium]
MSRPKTLILRTAGTNCDSETAHAFELAGATAEGVHLNRVLKKPDMLRDYQLMALPGGFSYGDDIAAGRIFANQIQHHLREAFHGFVDAGKPIIGICNGFQVLVKTDLLPGSIGGRAGQTCTLTNNDRGRFIDRWVRLTPKPSKCIWTAGMEQLIELPIAHGEGKFVPASDVIRRALHESGQVALIYAKEDGSPANGTFPDNPNGSVDDIAGVCDFSGLVFGLMPHPERYVRSFQHPSWTRHRQVAEGVGLRVFRNAVQYAQTAVGTGV